MKRSLRCCSAVVLVVAAVALLDAGSAMASELSWSAPQKIDATESPYSYPSLRVSCATASFCVAVDANTNAMIYNGSSWTAPTSVEGSFPFRLYAVSCPTASFCMAGGGGNALTYNGSSWSAPAHVESSFEAASCPLASFCVAVGGDEAISYNGSAWSAPVHIDSAEEEWGLGSVSCPSSSFCMAVDLEGHAVTYNGSSWSAPADIDGTEGIGGVSCVSSSFCIAVDWSGNVLTYNGSSWSAGTNIGGAASVSCPSTSFCAAVVGGNGNALTYNGSSWTTATGVISPSEGASVSCASSSFCVATDNNGNAVTYAEHEASGSGGSGGAPPSGGGASNGGGSSGTGSGAVTLHVGGTLPVSHNAVHVAVQCIGSGSCTGKVTLTANVHGSRAARSSVRPGAAGKIIGRHAFSIAAGKSASVAIHLNAAGKKALRTAHGKLKARLVVSGTASGKAVNESKAVTLTTGRK